MSRMLVPVLAVVLVVGLSSFQPEEVYAQQQDVPVECGTIIEGVMSQPDQEDNYVIELGTGDQIDIQYTTLGETTDIEVRLFDEIGTQLALIYYTTAQILELIPLSGLYRIQLNQRSGLGLYTLSIGCTIAATGEVIEPGDAPPVRAAVAADAPSYPNLAPTTFESPIALPLLPATPMTGAIAAQETYTYSIDAQAGAADVTVTRVSGNRGLGVVVVSPSGAVLFYGGLIATSDLAVTLDLPEAGTHTVAVFSVALGMPADPQPTAFQVLFAQG